LHTLQKLKQNLLLHHSMDTQLLFSVATYNSTTINSIPGHYYKYTELKNNYPPQQQKDLYFPQ
jgi:hypothetical protein